MVAAYNRPGTAPIVADRDDRDIRQAKQPRYLRAEDDAAATSRTVGATTRYIVGIRKDRSLP